MSFEIQTQTMKLPNPNNSTSCSLVASGRQANTLGEDLALFVPLFFPFFFVLIDPIDAFFFALQLLAP
jgi:uncharacterized membrane protein